MPSESRPDRDQPIYLPAFESTCPFRCDEELVSWWWLPLGSELWDEVTDVPGDAAWDDVIMTSRGSKSDWKHDNKEVAYSHLHHLVNNEMAGTVVHTRFHGNKNNPIKFFN